MAKFNFKESWKPVVEYDGWYSVSNKGRIRRDRPGRSTYSGRILKCSEDFFGYPVVNLHKNGISKIKKVHVLIMEAFVGKRPNNLDINHIDGVKSNNLINNLEYISRSENCIHAFKMQLNPGNKGEKNGRALLTDLDIIEIRKKYIKRKHTLEKLSKEFGVCISSIGRIVNNKHWKHIET